MSDMAASSQRIISYGDACKCVSLREEHFRFHMVAHELKIATRLPPCEYLDGGPLFKCALVRNFDECAVATGIHEDVCASEAT